MEEKDKKRFVEILTGVNEVLTAGKNKLSKIGMRIYYESLKKYGIIEIESAFIELLKTYKYNTMPKPADVIGVIDNDYQDKAFICWEQIMATVRSGQWRSPESFGDEINNTVRLMGGWSRLGMIKESEIPFREKEFIEKFKIASKTTICIDCNNSKIKSFTEKIKRIE